MNSGSFLMGRMRWSIQATSRFRFDEPLAPVHPVARQADIGTGLHRHDQGR